jgi:small nuclear ribonucleoprotein (snRNP)-like protein
MKNLIQRKLRTRFHVTPRVGYQFSGVLISEDSQYAVFTDVVAYPDDSTPEKADGDLYIRHTNVAYVQTVPPHESQ